MQFLEFSFVMTIFFMLLGPIKVIAPFARLTRSTEPPFKRSVAIQAAILASVICAAVALLTGNFVAKYQLGIPALQITAGLILLISALNAIFPRPEANAPTDAPRSALQAALSPLATPVIVPPAGVAAIMVFVLLAQQQPAAYQTIAAALATVMVLNFVVMLFNDAILKLPGLMPLLQLLGAVLVVVQVALAIQELIYGFAGLGLIVKA